MLLLSSKENLINDDLDPSSCDESGNESENESEN